MEKRVEVLRQFILAANYLLTCKDELVGEEIFKAINEKNALEQLEKVIHKTMNFSIFKESLFVKLSDEQRDSIFKSGVELREAFFNKLVNTESVENFMMDFVNGKYDET